jgi:ferrous iron transport protein B
MHHAEPTRNAHPGLRVALLGSPNAGKTTVFNALTGLRAKTANYPGVTVSRHEGVVRVGEQAVQVVDLPGSYGLTAVSPDEQVVVDTLDPHGAEPPDAVVMVVDATALERSLLFVAEVLRLDLPTCLVLTMVDEVAARGGTVDAGRLSAALGVPVVPVIGHRGVGLDHLRPMLADPHSWQRPVLLPPAERAERAAWVTSVLRAAVTPPGPDRRSLRIDAVLLHPVWGVAVFAVTMVVFFQAIFAWAAPLIDGLDAAFSWLADRLHALLPGLLGDLLADGLIAGVGSVVVFLPQIVLLFCILAVLEKVGYLARAAFLADRVMGRFGLEGRSFVAMLSSFACAVPGILATRTIPSERRRLATMLGAPLMTCSARLPVFTLMISTFVPDQAVLGPLRSQGLALFALYVLGAVSGLVYSGILSHTVLAGATAPFVMELPPYRRPTLRSILLSTWDGAGSFLRRAGTIILATSLVLWLLLNVPRLDPPAGLSDAEAASYEMEHSLAGRLGAALEPVFAPLGFEWHTNVAIIGSFAAREVFVSTLALTTASESEAALPERLQELEHDDGSPVFDSATVAAVLVFFVYALQCLATVAVLRRESNSWRWPVRAVVSMFVLAYVGALLARTVVGALT